MAKACSWSLAYKVMVVCNFLICGDFLSTGHPVLEKTMVLSLNDLAFEGQSGIIAVKTNC